MANRLRRIMPKRFQLYQHGAGAIAHVSKTQQPQSQGRSWLSSTLAIAILVSSAGSVLVITWLSILFIFNPEKITWVNQLLPDWAKVSLGNGEQKQTLQQIQIDLSKRKQIAGKTLSLDQVQDNSFLLPVFQQRPNCQSNCQVLVELRVYQRSRDLDLPSETEKYYHLVTKLPVTGLDESFVLDAESEHQAGDTILPLNEIQRWEGQSSAPGVWFYAWGRRQQETGAIAYGHIIYYNPERANLQQMLSWKSLSGQIPKWQQVTGGGAKELVIDHTIGIEPQLQIYQVKSVNLFLNPIQLEEIALQPPALSDSAYQDALLIARSGLWTPAFEWLQSLHKQRQAAFPLAAQAQMDVIRLHSQLTKAQAEKSWASPGQQVLADLIDGRWQKALQVFTASSHNIPEIIALLKADQGRLWKRTQAALQVNPNRKDVQTWAALMLAVQHDRGRANSWLQAQPKITPDTIAEIQGLLARIDHQSPSSSSHPSRIVGSIQPITQIKNTDWLQPDPQADLQLAENEVWYQMQVSAFDNGKGWLNYPFGNLQLPKTNPGKSLWQTLGISSNPEIQIVTWLPNGEQQVTTATIKAVQLRGGVLRLLATGQIMPNYQHNAVQPRPLALTNAALEWVQPSAITLAELSQNDPQAMQEMLPKVWRSLQNSGQIPENVVPDWQQMKAILGDWPVQMIDLTNNGKPEIVMTISAEAIASLTQTTPSAKESDKDLSRPRTLIFSDSGNIIYTDFQKNSQQALTAIAKLADNTSLALLVESADNYSLKRWSNQNQRFE
jgi:hypothetical protein